MPSNQIPLKCSFLNLTVQLLDFTIDKLNVVKRTFLSSQLSITRTFCYKIYDCCKTANVCPIITCNIFSWNHTSCKSVTLEHSNTKWQSFWHKSTTLCPKISIIATFCPIINIFCCKPSEGRGSSLSNTWNLWVLA